MEFADLIAPITEDRFMTEYWDRRPLHIPAPAGSNRGAVVGWQRLNELLQIRSHWTEAQTKLVLNSRPVNPDFYMETLSDGLRVASPARVETFLAMGASLVADGVERIAPEVRAVTERLAGRFAGRANANLYASFQGV
jgi:bifunctional lysine-specific demethylase and histidyl-hydroxylase NO66